MLQPPKKQPESYWCWNNLAEQWSRRKKHYYTALSCGLMFHYAANNVVMWQNVGQHPYYKSHMHVSVLAIFVRFSWPAMWWVHIYLCLGTVIQKYMVKTITHTKAQTIQTISMIIIIHLCDKKHMISYQCICLPYTMVYTWYLHNFLNVQTYGLYWIYVSGSGQYLQSFPHWQVDIFQLTWDMVN